MKRLTPIAAIGVLFAFAATTTQAQTCRPGVPRQRGRADRQREEGGGSAAADGHCAALCQGRRKTPPPSAAGEVFMIESPEGLVECSGTYLSEYGLCSFHAGEDEASRGSGP